jgi:hypothetical protein
MATSRRGCRRCARRRGTSTPSTGWEVPRHHPPRLTGSDVIEDRVDDLTRLVLATSARWPGRRLEQQRLDQAPMLVGQIGGIATRGECGRHHARTLIDSSPETSDARQPFSDTHSATVTSSLRLNLSSAVERSSWACGEVFAQVEALPGRIRVNAAGDRAGRHQPGGGSPAGARRPGVVGSFSDSSFSKAAPAETDRLDSPWRTCRDRIWNLSISWQPVGAEARRASPFRTCFIHVPPA